MQIINELAFTEQGILFKDYEELMSSLFANHQYHLAVLDLLAKQRYGATLETIATAVSLRRGAALSSCLNELSAAGFIKSYVPFGRRKKGVYYRIIDEYTIFYKRWIEPLKESQLISQQDYWLKASQSAQFHSFAGYNFETILLKTCRPSCQSTGH